MPFTALSFPGIRFSMPFSLTILPASLTSNAMALALLVDVEFMFTLNAIKKFEPDFLIHGHIHEASGMEEFIGKTKVINVSGRDKIIDI